MHIYIYIYIIIDTFLNKLIFLQIHQSNNHQINRFLWDWLHCIPFFRMSWICSINILTNSQDTKNLTMIHGWIEVVILLHYYNNVVMQKTWNNIWEGEWRMVSCTIQFTSYVYFSIYAMFFNSEMLKQSAVNRTQRYLAINLLQTVTRR